MKPTVEDGEGRIQSPIQSFDQNRNENVVSKCQEFTPMKPNSTPRQQNARIKKWQARRIFVRLLVDDYVCVRLKRRAGLCLETTNGHLSIFIEKAQF